MKRILPAMALRFTLLTLLGALTAGGAIAADASLGLGRFKPDGPEPFAKNFKASSFTIRLEAQVCGKGDVSAFCWRPEGDSPRKNIVIAYMPYPNENIENGGMCAKQFAEDGGFTVVSIPFKTDDGKQEFDLFDKTKSYLMRSSGYPAAVLEAFAKVCGESGIRSPDFYCAGYSGGGILAQRMREWYPDKCSASASFGGHTFMHGMTPSTAPLFVSHVFRDAGADEVPGLTMWTRQNGSPVTVMINQGEWHSRGVPTALFTHHPRVQDQPVLHHWLEDMADLRLQNKDEKDVKSWPYAVSVPNQNEFGDPQFNGPTASHWPPLVFSTEKAGWREAAGTSVMGKGSTPAKPAFVLLPGRKSVSDWIRSVQAPYSFNLLAKTEGKNPPGPATQVWWCPPSPFSDPIAFCWRLRTKRAVELEGESPEDSQNFDLRFMADKGYVSISGDAKTLSLRSNREKAKSTLVKLCPAWSELADYYILEDPGAADIKGFNKPNESAMVVLNLSDKGASECLASCKKSQLPVIAYRDPARPDDKQAKPSEPELKAPSVLVKDKAPTHCRIRCIAFERALDAGSSLVAAKPGKDEKKK